jgi:23S rRNA pseudouridine1911/1915/1917 synthase
VLDSGEKTLIFRRLSRDADARLDRFLSDNKGVDLSRARIQGLIKIGAITVNGERKKPSYQLRHGDRITVRFLSLPISLEASQDVEFELLYEDKSIAVVNKPPGVVVHPSAGHHTGTLVHGLLYRCADLSSLSSELRPGIVHRLDKDTSGVMVVAKNDRAHAFLADQFKRREVRKRYLALVHGKVEKGQGIVDLPIGRHPVKRKEMSVSLLKGRRAITEWEVMVIFSLGFSLLRVTIHTGRTHQIRVHLSYMGYPVVGDIAYGYPRRWWRQQGVVVQEALPLVKRQMLHAEVLGFVHPDSLKHVTFTAPVPADVEALLTWFQKNEPYKC